MLVKLLRNGLGYTIAFVDKLTRPKPLQRSAEDQQAVNEAAKALSIYQFYGCPFCIKTRRAVHALNIPLTYRDAQAEGEFRNELLEQGGKVQVPCLRISEADKLSWLYESDVIIRYLKERFGPDKA